MIADEAIKRLEAAKAKPDEPFFLAVGFLKPHLPFVAPKKYWDLYDPASFKLPELQKAPEGAPEFAPSSWGELRQYKDMPDKGPVTKEQAIHLIHGYHAATSYMDAQLGKVLDALDSNGFAENTIIVLWGDHGWHLGDHGMWCKHTNYEQAARIPLLVAAPGIAGGQHTQALVETVDIYPTLAELASLPAPAKLDGRSFASVLKNPATSTRSCDTHTAASSRRMEKARRCAWNGGPRTLRLRVRSHRDEEPRRRSAGSRRGTAQVARHASRGQTPSLEQARSEESRNQKELETRSWSRL
jgi:iduronate 2-sulfatase